MTNSQFAAAVVTMIDDPSAYRRCSVKDLVLIGAVLEAIREGIGKELASRKRKPSLRLIQK